MRAKEIDPDVWLDAQKAFKKFFHYPQHIQREHLELLVRPCPWPTKQVTTEEPEAREKFFPTLLRCMSTAEVA
jgi:hypothetical protein